MEDRDLFQRNLRRLWASRAGGGVTRCHTWPTLRNQTNAAHTYGVLSIVFCLNPSPTLSLVKWVMQHDLPEFYTGDIPANVKWDNPGFDDIIGRIEERFHEQNNMASFYEFLTEQDKLVFAWADSLELYITCLEEYCMGNTTMLEIMRRVETKLDTIGHHPVGAAILVELLRCKTERRLPWLEENNEDN